MAKDLIKLFGELKEDLKKEVRTLKDSFDRDIRADLREVKSGMDFMNAHFEQMKQKIDDVLRENMTLKNQNDNLRQTNEAMQKDMKQFQARLLHCEQYTRNANLEVKGLAKRDNEDLEAVLAQIGDLIGEPITPADVEVCHRVPTRITWESNIVIQFVSRRKRDVVLMKAKKKDVSHPLISACHRLYQSL